MVIKNSIVTMGDNQRLTVKNERFSLVRIRPECKIPPTIVDFSTPFIHTASSSITPAFNHDGQYFTPAFILPSEKTYNRQNRGQLLDQFEDKVKRTMSQTCISEVFRMTPSSKYCQICRQCFPDYFQHLEHKGHVLRSTNNETNQFIRNVCEVFQKQRDIFAGSGKTKLISKNNKKNLQKTLPNKLKKMNEIINGIEN